MVADGWLRQLLPDPAIRQQGHCPTADKGAIAVGDKGKLVTVLEAVIAAVKSGELDAAIETVKGAERGVKRKAA